MSRLMTALLLLALLAGCARPAPAPQEPAPPAPPAPQQAVTPPPPPPPKPPRVEIDPPRVLQGDFATLRLDKPVAGEVKVQVEGLWEQPKFFRHQGRPVAFIGFPAASRVGSYPVTVTWEGGEWTGSIEVLRKQFTEDRLIVTEQQEQVYFDPRSAEEWARVFKLRGESHPEPYWYGPFRPPLEGALKITTYFGEIRFVNGKETGRHSGMDFGAPTGTPILAPARGRVILAEKLIVSGWTVIIDHGQNLFTAYYHCETLAVKPGDMLQTGDVIGTVGSTGFSTGPHLHWTATIGNTPVDPWPLTQAPPLGLGAASEPNAISPM